MIDEVNVNLRMPAGLLKAFDDKLKRGEPEMSDRKYGRMRAHALRAMMVLFITDGSGLMGKFVQGVPVGEYVASITSPPNLKKG
jgi:hypothetical protein